MAVNLIYATKIPTCTLKVIYERWISWWLNNRSRETIPYRRNLRQRRTYLSLCETSNIIHHSNAIPFSRYWQFSHTSTHKHPLALNSLQSRINAFRYFWGVNGVSLHVFKWVRIRHWPYTANFIPYGCDPSSSSLLHTLDSRMEPCGTPDTTCFQLDDWPSPALTVVC